MVYLPLFFFNFFGAKRFLNIMKIVGSKLSKGQFFNAVSFKIIVVSYAIEIINCQENQLNI